MANPDGRKPVGVHAGFGAADLHEWTVLARHLRQQSGAPPEMTKVQLAQAAVLLRQSSTPDETHPVPDRVG
jgi:hypothetical protein